MSTGFNFIVSNESPFMMLLDINNQGENCLDSEFITPRPFIGQKFPIPPNTSFTARLYRKDGHGCNGCQGIFQARPIYLVENKPVVKEYQLFSFDSHGSIGLVGGPSDYISHLQQEKAAADAYWVIKDEYPANPSDDIKKQAIKSYAPKVWFADDAEYFPCTPEWAFPNFIRYKDSDGKYWIKTKKSLSNPSDDSLHFFKGDLASAKTYAFWVPKNGGHFDIAYFVFYPYNRGKEKLNTVWGNHVGDWEHITVRLDSNLEPVNILFSQHDTDQIVSWSSVEKEDGRPVAYSAWGSHAFYPTAGDHHYKSIPVLGDLVDKCSQGTPWDTVTALELFDYLGPEIVKGVVVEQKGKNLETLESWPLWMSIKYTEAGSNPEDPAAGAIYRWGNKEDGCQPNPINDKNIACRLESGPTGPIDKGDIWSPGKEG